MTLQGDLKAIEERAKAATPGPWDVDRYSNDTIRWMGPSAAALAAADQMTTEPLNARRSVRPTRPAP